MAKIEKNKYTMTKKDIHCCLKTPDACGSLEVSEMAGMLADIHKEIDICPPTSAMNYMCFHIRVKEILGR